jgi:CheY-like chemotaxis protein
MNSSGSLKARTILIIEDDDDARYTYRLLLESVGADVMVAANGVEGFAQLERRRPDAILCDLTMPVMDGLEFARSLRRDPRYRQVLLIAVTGRGEPRDLMDTWRAGFDGHLVKPLTMETLNVLAQRLVRPPISGANGA